ncbi:hypothetical protein [Thiocapsa sp.]|nr:hypothetical protein [Thiocapsa sp.]
MGFKLLNLFFDAGPRLDCGRMHILIITGPDAGRRPSTPPPAR